MKEKLHFSERLLELMAKRGDMTASELAKKVGVSHVTIGNYLVDQPPKSVHLVSIARYFNVSTDWLLGLVGESMFDKRGQVKEHSEGPWMLAEKPTQADQGVVSEMLGIIARMEREIGEIKRHALKLQGEPASSCHGHTSRTEVVIKHPLLDEIERQAADEQTGSKKASQHPKGTSPSEPSK